MNFPNDENGDVLRKMEKRGDVLSKPRDINFYFAFSVEHQANHFAEQVQLTTGLRAETSRYEERNMWQVCVTRHMIPTHQEITALENSLSDTAKLYDGEADGWGCFKVSNEKR